MDAAKTYSGGQTYYDITDEVIEVDTEVLACHLFDLCGCLMFSAPCGVCSADGSVEEYRSHHDVCEESHTVSH